MRIIEVIKETRDKTIRDCIVIENHYSDFGIDMIAEDWAENEPSGIQLGYSISWKYVKDKRI